MKQINPLHFMNTLPPDEVRQLATRRDDAPGLRITEVPSHERSEDGKTDTGRPGGNPAALPLAPGPSYQEPWAWDAKLGVVVDRQGLTVANMILTDLSVMEQEEFGRRIALCLNFLKGSPNEWLRNTQTALDAAKQAVSR